MFKIFPYKIGSASAKKLKEELDGLFIKLKNSNYRYRDGHIVINWGNSHRPAVLEGVDMLNEPEAVAIATNKLTALEELADNGVATAPFTTEIEIAEEWLSGGEKVFVRNELNGHSGAGIEVVFNTLNQKTVERNLRIDAMADELEALEEWDFADELRDKKDEAPELELPDAPLYTMGLTNRGEYRVHVFQGDVILYQKKSRRVDEETGEVVTAEGEDADIRNLASNWIYRTGNLKKLERIEELAVSAVEALGLDFGAVDIIMDNEGNVFVLEVNTAPGLGNTETLEAYCNAFKTLEDE